MEYSESVLRTVCCTCISVDRRLFQVCRVPEGINNLYHLLSYDTEAYTEGFFRRAANLFMCWECILLLKKLCDFRNRVCEAQKQLKLISSGVNKAKHEWKCLSTLSMCYKNSFDVKYTESEHTPCDNFVDCGIDIEIKTESETDDIPLSHLQMNDSKTEVTRETKVHNKQRKHMVPNQELIWLYLMKLIDFLAQNMMSALKTKTKNTNTFRDATENGTSAPLATRRSPSGVPLRANAKGLCEHEWTHTAERPLACAECGRAFRYSAALAAHRRRLHKIVYARPSVVVADT